MISAAINVVVLLLLLAPGPEGEDAAALLDRLDRRSAPIQTVSARFRQVRHSAVLARPLESSGRVRATRTLVRWDTAAPFASVTTVSATAVRIHHPDHALLEVYELDEQLGPLGATPLPRLAALRERFRIELEDPGEPATLTLRLAPIAERVAALVAEVRLVVDAETGLVVRARVTDAHGERTEITFHDVVIDERFDDRDLELAVPEGTRIVRRGAPPTDGGER